MRLDLGTRLNSVQSASLSRNQASFQGRYLNPPSLSLNSFEVQLFKQDLVTSF
jgi:hypothetical protein